MSTQQFGPNDVAQAKERGFMLNTLRDIVILQKEGTKMYIKIGRPISRDIINVNPEYEALCIPLTSEEYECLKESIRKDRLWIPLIVNPDGVVLDGHHRYRACKEVGRPWDDPKSVVKRFGSKLLEKKFIIETNLKRRQLTTLQKVEMAMIDRSKLVELLFSCFFHSSFHFFPLSIDQEFFPDL